MAWNYKAVRIINGEIHGLINRAISFINGTLARGTNVQGGRVMFGDSRVTDKAAGIVNGGHRT